MNGLIVDTTADAAVICVIKQEEYFYGFGDGNKGKTSETIIPNIKKLIEKAGLGISDINAFFVVCGPGSFTGIRIGVSSVSAMAYALGGDTYALNVFDGFDAKEELCVIPSRKGYFYYSLNGVMGELSEQEVLAFNGKVISYGAVLPMINESGVSDSAVCTLCELSINDYARNLCSAALKAVQSGKKGTLVPVYLKKCQAERNLDAKRQN